MGIMNITISENNVIVSGISDFDLAETLECGQCFRWNKNEDNSYTGVAHSKVVTIKQIDDTLFFYDTTKDDFYNIWYNYFDLGRDYGEIKKQLSKDPVMKEALSFGGGIRILKQDLWETIVSFIISASNNIPRIKKIIELFSKEFGEEITYMGKTYYSFPTPDSLSDKIPEDLSPIRAGFRDKYIIDAANKVLSGEINLYYIQNADTKTAKQELMKIYGIGNKVADCIILFSLARTESFPVDVWIKRIMEHLYFDNKQSIKNVQEFAYEKFGELSGFAQQYLFFYARENKIG